MSISNESEEAGVAYFKVPVRNFRIGTDKRHEEPRFSASRSNFELGKQEVTEYNEEGSFIICSLSVMFFICYLTTPTHMILETAVVF
jgi:hypothetical protein